MKTSWPIARLKAASSQRLPRPASIAFNFVVSAFIVAVLWLGNAELSFTLMAFSTLVCLTLTSAGESTLGMCGLNAIQARLSTAFVVGFVAISLPTMALTVIFDVTPLTAFGISAFPTLVLGFWRGRRETIPGPNDWYDTAIALLLAVTIGLLAKAPISSPATMLSTGILPIWSDYFLHGVTIASLGSPLSSRVDMELAGVGIGFYHYAPFIIPAAFEPLSGMSGLALATSLLLPLGLLVAGFGSYAFAVALGERLSGLLALTAIICIPSFSFFIDSGWFDFYWILFATPGTGYALGVSAVVCALTFYYLERTASRTLWLTFALLFSMILIRAHIFLLLAPAIIAIILLHQWRKNIRMIVGVAVAVILTTGLYLSISKGLHTYWLEHSHPYDYLNLSLQWSLIFGNPIKVFEFPFLTTLLQLGIVLVAVTGIYFILYPMLLWLKSRRLGLRWIDALPLLLTGSFLALILFAPIAGNGDLTEYKHRHFPLLYAVMAIYTVTYAVALTPAYVRARNGFERQIGCLVIFTFLATIIFNWHFNPARPNVQAMPWSSKLDNQLVIPGALNAAHYLIANAEKGDVLATGVAASNTSDVNSLNIEMVALTGIPAFVSRPDLKMMRSRCIRDLVKKRLELLAGLALVPSWPEARAFLQENGIRWFLAMSNDRPGWDARSEFSVFSDLGLSVYDAGQSAKQNLKSPCGR